MCIIVAIPQGKKISKQVVKRCWENNPHGGGFMYSDGKKVIVEKEMSSFKRYCKALILEYQLMVRLTKRIAILF
jgi:hypothetical protein